MSLTIKLYVGLVFSFLSFLVAVSIFGCGEASSSTSSYVEGRFNYESIRQEIIEPYCLRCHDGGERDLSSYEAVMRYVEPGDPETSKLYRLVQSELMPPKKPLEQALAERLRSWIVEGAPRS